MIFCDPCVLSRQNNTGLVETVKNNIEIMLIEDNPAYRTGIACALDGQSDMELISGFGTAEIALRSLENASAENMRESDA